MKFSIIEEAKQKIINIDMEQMLAASIMLEK
jgi:hypothetical protein